MDPRAHLDLVRHRAFVRTAGALVLVIAAASFWVFVTRPASRGESTAALGQPEPAAPGGAEAPEPLAPVGRTPETERVVAPLPGPEDVPAARGEPAAARELERGEDVLALRGRVLFPNGAGVPGASVRLGLFATRTDERGDFALALSDGGSLASPLPLYSHQSPLDSLEPETALVAWFAGWIPAVRGEVGRLVEEARGRPGAELEPVVLVLSEVAWTIDGVVLDRAGTPAGGWRVALLDGTPAYDDDFRPFTAEELASGTSSHIETTAEGTFAFGGLTPGRSYRVRAWNQHTLEQVVSDPLPAGARGVVLRAPADPWRPRIDGAVVGLDGTLLSGVKCRLTMAEYEREGAKWMSTGQEAITDELGRFAFTDVPPVALFIRFNGYGSGQELELPPHDPCRGLRVELVRSGAFVLERGPASPAPDVLRILDEQDQRLRIEQDVGEGMTSGTRDVAVPAAGPVRGRVSESARWLVLYAAGQELARLSLVVRYGEEARLRW